MSILSYLLRTTGFRVQMRTLGNRTNSGFSHLWLKNIPYLGAVDSLWQCLLAVESHSSLELSFLNQPFQSVTVLGDLTS